MIGKPHTLKPSGVEMFDRVMKSTFSGGQPGVLVDDVLRCVVFCPTCYGPGSMVFKKPGYESRYQPCDAHSTHGSPQSFAPHDLQALQDALASAPFTLAELVAAMVGKPEAMALMVKG